MLGVVPLTTPEIMQTIEDLVALGPRRTGTPEGRAAADYVRARFDAAGLSTEFLDVPSLRSRVESCELRVDGITVPCSPVLHSGLPGHGFTGRSEHRLDARVVDIGAGKVDGHDVRDAIVLFDLTFDMSLYSLLPLTAYLHDPGRQMLRRDVLSAKNPYITSLTRVMSQAGAAGAVGVIGVLRDYPESLAYHNEYYRRTLLELPGVWITRDAGTGLRARLTTTSRAEVTLDTLRERVQARTVLGVLPGRTNETIMVQSHHDSVGPGAVQDASGAAEVIALAEHFAGQGQPDKTLLFVTFDTHFTGYQAHQEFARRFVLSPDSPYDIVLNATIEHIGLRAVRGPDGGFQTLPQTEPRGIFANVNPAFIWNLARSIRTHGLHSTCILHATPLEFTRDGIPTDASFTLVAGVPTISLISGPLYLYDDADTVDKIDVEQLVPVARFFTDVVDHAQRSAGSRLGLLPAVVRRRLPRGRW